MTNELKFILYWLSPLAEFIIDQELLSDLEESPLNPGLENKCSTITTNVKKRI